MARTPVPVTEITRAGVANATPVVGDPVNNHSVANDGHMFVEVANTGATDRTVTVHVAATVDGQAVASRSTVVAQSTTRRLGPWPTAVYGTLLLVDVDNAELALTAYRLP